MRRSDLPAHLLDERNDERRPEKWRAAECLPLAHTIEADYGLGVIAVPNDGTPSPLHRLALIAARYGVPNLAEVAAANDLTAEALRTANAALNALTYRQHFQEPLPTLDGPTLARLTGSNVMEAARHYCAILGTSAERGYREARAKTHPDQNATLKRIKEKVKYYERDSRVTNTSPYLDEPCRMSYATYCRVRLAEMITHEASRYEAERDERARTEQLLEELQQRAGIPLDPDGLAEFAPVRLGRPPLAISHTGRLGRSVRPSDRGRSVRFAANYYADPQRRVLGRVQRGNRAVVLIDCSGSMGLTAEQVEQMMSASAGATVIGYSNGRNEERPNTHILARNGRRVRKLPHFAGGNGCDGPALIYAQSQRRNGAPLIYVTDGGVTNALDNFYPAGLRTVTRLAQAYGAIVVETSEEAVETLRAMRRGKQVRPTLGPLRYRTRYL